MKNIINHILRKYEGKDWLLKRKAKTLLRMILMFIVAIVIDLTASSHLLNKLAPEFYSNSTILVVLLLILFLLVNGKYDFASGLSIVVFIVGITWTRLQKLIKTGYKGVVNKSDITEKLFQVVDNVMSNRLVFPRNLKI